MDPIQNQNFNQNLGQNMGQSVETHQTKKLIYGAVGIVLVIAIVLVVMTLLGGKEVVPVYEPSNLTAEELLIKSMTATGPSTLTPEEEARLSKSMTATGGSTLSAAELSKLKASMTAKKK
ncbi:MAG: hypothetical protein AAB726_01925 [Patescibacteria group bacterium]